MRLKIALMLGGLRPGFTEPVTTDLREEILHHWHTVHKMTGQPFDFSNPMPEGFIYDTEPASRAVIAVSEINPNVTLRFFKNVQQAFYEEQKDVTDEAVLADLAERFSISEKDFLEYYNSDFTKEKTAQHFQNTRRAEIKGFPALVISAGNTFKVLANGYRSYDDMAREIDDWLEEYSQNKSESHE